MSFWKALSLSLVVGLVIGLAASSPSWAQPFSNVVATAYCKLAGCTMTGTLSGTSVSMTAESTLAEGFEASGDYDTACGTVAVRMDTDGINWCPLTTNTAPTSMMISPMDNFGGGAQTATTLVLRGGIDEKSIAIDNNANCNAADTVTATIGIGNAATAACTCTYGTNWCTGTCNTDDLVAASLAACLNACTGIDSTSTTDPTTLQIDPTEGQVRVVTLTESDATCTTVANGTDLGIGAPLGAVGAPSYSFAVDSDTGMYSSGANAIDFTTGGVVRMSIASTGTVSVTGSFAMPSAQPITFGTNMGAIRGDTGQTPDGLVAATGSLNNAIIICEAADAGGDMAHAQQTNPTLWIQSAQGSVQTTQWMSFAHDQTNGVIDVGTGVVSIPDGITTAGTIVTTGTATIGWSIVTAANQACTTTCTTACVHGQDTDAATKPIVDCADATADRCVCAGAS